MHVQKLHMNLAWSAAAGEAKELLKKARDAMKANTLPTL